MHERNRHRERYNFPELIAATPELATFVARNEYGDDSIDFADPQAVKALNRSLLRRYYGITEWDIPDGYLCPPIPGRADYLHSVADLLAESNSGVVPRGESVLVLDVGVGANCIYPIIGRHEYGWRFVGTDIDVVAVDSARRIIRANPELTGKVECRLQRDPRAIFRDVVKPGEAFAVSICNPPFHASAAAAAAGTERKLRNLGASRAGRPILNFGGQRNELWCEGGELKFVERLVRESARSPALCRWFTSLVSKAENLPAIHRALRAVRATDVRTIPMAQGQKQSRIVAWTFGVPPKCRRPG